MAMPCFFLFLQNEENSWLYMVECFSSSSSIVSTWSFIFFLLSLSHPNPFFVFLKKSRPLDVWFNRDNVLILCIPKILLNIKIVDVFVKMPRLASAPMWTEMSRAPFLSYLGFVSLFFSSKPHGSECVQVCYKQQHDGRRDTVTYTDANLLHNIPAFP